MSAGIRPARRQTFRLLRIATATLLFAAWIEPARAEAAPGAAAQVRAVIPVDSPPTYYRDRQTGQAAGFAVDVMNAVAGRAGLTVTYTYRDSWAEIIEVLKRGEADLAPGMGVSPDREKDLAFSAPIDTFPISFFVRAEHRGIDASPGTHVVGGVRGSVALEKLAARPGLTLLPYDGYQVGLFDLLAGKIEAFACPVPTLWRLARESGVDDHIKVVDKPIAEITRGIAVRRDNRALLGRLNAAIEGYVGSDAYRQVYVKWYGRPVPYWTPQRIVLVGSAFLAAVVALMAVWRHASVLRLNRELTRTADALQLNQERLESLVRIAQSRAGNTEELLAQALEEAIRLTRSRIGYVYFYDEDRREFTLNTWSSEVMRECSVAEPQKVYRLEKTGIWGEAVRQRKPIVVQDFDAPNPLKKGYPLGHAPLHSFLTVPVFMQERIVAVVGVANKQAAYEQDDIRQLTLLMDAVWRMVEYRKVQTALGASERKYRTVFDSAIDGIFIVGMDGRLIDVNRTSHERLGYTREEMLAMHLSELDTPEFAGHVGARIGELLRQGRLTFESAHRRKDGTAMPVEISARIIEYDGGQAIVSVVRDVSERKLAEREREHLIVDLQQALAEIKTLHGVLPICSSCKKIRDDSGAWHQLEAYIRDRTDADFSHGLCSDCAKRLYPEYSKGFV